MLRPLVRANVNRLVAIARPNHSVICGIAHLPFRSLRTSKPLTTNNMEEPFEKMAQEGEPKCDVPTAAAAPEKEEQVLPKLSAKDFRVYNRMAEHMDMFHEHFRQTWNTMYRACENGKRPAGISMRAFLNMAEEFCHHCMYCHGSWAFFCGCCSNRELTVLGYCYSDDASYDRRATHLSHPGEEATCVP